MTTFEEYCEGRWEMSKVRVHQVIECADAAMKMGKIFPDLPARESHVRALLAAESWKRLYPERCGAGRPAKGKENSKEIGNYDEFAMKHFKVNSLYAQQAATISVHYPELLEDAKAGHFDFRARVVIIPEIWARESNEMLMFAGAESNRGLRIAAPTTKLPAKKSTPWMLRSPSGFATAGSLSHPSHRHRDTSAESGRHPLSHHWACSSSGHRSGPRWMPDSSSGRVGTLQDGPTWFTMANHRLPDPRCCEPLQPATLASGVFVRTMDCASYSVKRRANAGRWGDFVTGTTPA